jgi:hypothetical protein
MEDYECRMTLEQASARFKSAQEALKAFIQEHMEFGVDGLEFIGGRNRAALDREYASLKEEHDAAGAQWAAALSKTPVEVRQ